MAEIKRGKLEGHGIRGLSVSPDPLFYTTTKPTIFYHVKLPRPWLRDLLQLIPNRLLCPVVACKQEGQVLIISSPSTRWVSNADSGLRTSTLMQTTPAGDLERFPKLVNPHISCAYCVDLPSKCHTPASFFWQDMRLSRVPLLTAHVTDNTTRFSPCRCSAPQLLNH
jgi:hypothetical protein